MIGLLLIYFIGKYFYDLAVVHQKSKWGFAILGVISYYAGTTIFGFAAGISIVLIDPELIESTPDMVWNFAAVPFGILATWLLYKYLKKKWESNGSESLDNILDADL